MFRVTLGETAKKYAYGLFAHGQFSKSIVSSEKSDAQNCTVKLELDSSYKVRF